MEQQKSVPTDSLKLLYLMTFGVMRLRCVKFILILIFVFHGTIGVIQIFDFLTTFDGHLLLRYGPFFLISCSCLVNISTVLTVEKSLSKLFIRLAISRFWTFRRFPEEISEQIESESRVVTCATVGALTILFMFSAIHVPIFGDKNFIYGLMLIEKSFDEMMDFLIFLYYCTLPVLAYVAFINGGVIIYTLMHLKFYISIINDHLKRICRNYDVIVDKYVVLKDEEYQNGVFEQIKVCIVRHQTVKLIEKKLNDILLPSLVLLLYLCVAAIIGMLFNILAEPTKLVFFLSTGGMCVSLVTPLLVVTIGQIVKNEYDRMYENLLNFPWIVWDSRNRKTLMFFMSVVQKSFFLGKPGLVLCEYSFIPSVMSVLWTVSTFIVEVASRE